MSVKVGQLRFLFVTFSSISEISTHRVCVPAHFRYFDQILNFLLFSCKNLVEMQISAERTLKTRNSQTPAAVLVFAFVAFVCRLVVVIVASQRREESLQTVNF